MRGNPIHKLLSRKYFVLIFSWIILTSINLNKAFHIDDTFHLEVAENILEDPGSPMSGEINWDNDPGPIHSHNQPVLFFYLLAVVSKLFGTNELPLHLLLSIFTFLAIFIFQKIAELVSPGHSKLLVLFFAFNPALIINQNVMVDVPLLACLLATLYFLLIGNNTDQYRYFVFSAIFMGLALLIKYSALPVFFVLLIIILINRDYKKLFVLLIPVFFLFAWSLWNYSEYGSVHLFDRHGGGRGIRSVWAFTAYAGALSTFVPSFIYGVFRFRLTRSIIYLVSALFILLVAAFYILPMEDTAASLPVYFIHFSLGIAFITCMFVVFFNEIRGRFSSFLKSDKFIILLYLASLSLFIIVSSPFIAARHLLLVIPFALLFGEKLLDKPSLIINRLSISFTIVLGVILGISDWMYADYYRDMAYNIELPENKKVWSAGHWGWQWYSKERGMDQYNTNLSLISTGDYLVYPVDIHHQGFNDNIELTVIDKKWKESNILTYFSGNRFASLYIEEFLEPAWNLSKSPVDTIYICRIKLINPE